jgi:hypothetical protein
MTDKRFSNVSPSLRLEQKPRDEANFNINLQLHHGCFCEMEKSGAGGNK